MGKYKKRSGIAVFMMGLLLMTASLSSIKVYGAGSETNRNTRSFVPTVESAQGYLTYLKEHENAKKTTDTIEVMGSQYTAADGMDVSVENGILTTGNSGSVSFEVSVPKEGLYQMQLEYLPVDNGGSGIEFGVYINRELLFEEANPIYLSRSYADADKKYKDMKGNQSFPSQIEIPEWTVASLRDYKGIIPEPLKFYFNQGSNTITIKAVKDCMQLKRIILTPPVETISYEEYINTYKDVKKGNAEIKIQAEDAAAKSSPSFYPLNDRTSAMSEPYDPSYIILNTIGGKSWGRSGEWLRYNAEVPEDGLYQIAVRYKQNEFRGMFAGRTILINGEIPFQEASELRFPYDSEFKVKDLAGSDEVFYFYLRKGVNTITLQNSLTEYADLIYRVNAIGEKINAVYQEIIVITGSAPDQYQDYKLTSRIPNMLTEFKGISELLADVKNDLLALSGTSNDKVAVLERNISLFESMVKKPSIIPKKVTPIKDSITALGQWTLDITTQPLTLDYLLIHGDGEKLPKGEGGFLSRIKHEFSSFVGSFTNDYNVFTSEEIKEKETIEVWVTTGRDQMDVIRRLVNESFTPKTGIPVKLKLVDSSVLLTATSVGRGPDAVIQVSSTVPVDFAVRDAAYDLTQFDDFGEVAARFHKATLDGYSYADKTYGLPDQMSFPVLFYRKDILNKYKIPVPDTWEDVISIIPYLQANNMEFYMDRDSLLTLGTAVGVGSGKAINTVYLSMLYQNGGELYNEKGTATLLNSDQSLKAFTAWTDFYTKHSFSVTMDFVTRFRLGEVPLAIMDFTNYNKLSVSAPEINGKWSIAMMPGTLREDGVIDHSLPVTTSASMMIRNSVEKRGTKEAAWDFLKWWTEADVQTAYAREMESILGSSGRYPVANLESFRRVSWKTEILNVLNESLDWLREVRQVPGSYITGRNIENAFYMIVNDKTADPVDIMYEYNDKMIEEIQNKLREFGLETE